jgi:hypothetical protein
MNYYDRYLSKISGTPIGRTDRNDRNGQGKSEQPPSDLLTETTETQTAVSVSNVSDSHQVSPDFTAPVLDPPSWRACIAVWPIPWRQKWADRAEAHQVAGLAWDVAEHQAFQETIHEQRAAS